MESTEKNKYLPDVAIEESSKKPQTNGSGPQYGTIDKDTEANIQNESIGASKSWRRWCRIEPFMVLLYVATNAVAISYPQLLYDMVAEDLGYDTSNGTADTGECVDGESQLSATSFQIRRKRAVTNHSYTTKEVTESDVQSEVNTWNILILASAMLPGVFMIIALGSWSDQVGRKKAIVPALIGCSIRTILYLFLAVFDWPMWTWVIAGLSEGMTGGTYTVLSVSFAYVIDVTTPENRSRNILILELCTGLGSIVAYLATGFMIDAWGYGAPIGMCFVIYIPGIFYVLFLLPESKTTVTKARLITLEHYKKSFKIFHPSITLKKTRLAIYGGLILLFLVALSASGGEGILNFYMLNYPICWDPITISLYKSSDYIIQAIGAIIFMRLLYKRVGELGLIIASCISGAAMYQYLAFSSNTAMIFTSSVLGCAVRIGQPMSRALLSKYVSRDQQGSLMSLSSLCSLLPLLVANMMFTSIYTATLDWWRGFAFTFVAAFYAIPVVLAILFISGRRKGIINETYEDTRTLPLKDEMTKF